MGGGRARSGLLVRHQTIGAAHGAAAKKEDLMEHDAEQDAGNGDFTTTEDIARGVDSAASSLGDLDRRLRPYIKAHPFVAVGLAAAAGFLLSRLVSRL